MIQGISKDILWIKSVQPKKQDALAVLALAELLESVAVEINVNFSSSRKGGKRNGQLRSPVRCESAL